MKKKLINRHTSYLILQKRCCFIPKNRSQNDCLLKKAMNYEIKNSDNEKTLSFISVSNLFMKC